MQLADTCSSVRMNQRMRDVIFFDLKVIKDDSRSTDLAWDPDDFWVLI